MKMKLINIIFAALISVFIIPFIPANGQTLDSLYPAVEKGIYGSIDAVLIANSDSILYENYFNDFEKDELHKCYSVTKSITSILFGVASKNDQLPVLDTPIQEFFPEYSDIFIKEPEKQKINLYQMFTMTAGFEWNEFGGIPRKYSESSDFIRSILEIPLESEPGTKFIYNTAISVLLGEILKRITKRNFDEYLKSELFEKLNITNYKLAFVAEGIPNSGGGLEMKADDLIKIGMMMLNNGAGIIPKEWINISTAKHVERGSGSDYGFHWWKYDSNTPIGKAVKINDIYFASGHGGQFLWVIPHANLTVTVFSKNFSQPKLPHKLFQDFILPIIQKSE